MKIILLLVFQTIILNSVFSQIGALDPTFGTNGVVITDVSSNLNDGAYSVLVKDDGFILLTGHATNSVGNTDFALVQYDSNGVLDNSFGTNGIVTLDINGFDDRASSSVIQSDGKIITVGYSYNPDADIIVVRFNADGSLDSTYATNGIYRFGYGYHELAKAVAILPSDKIVVGCQTNKNYALLKINATGIIDTNFGVNGIIEVNFTGDDYIQDIKVQVDGKILVTGISSKADKGDGDTYDMALFRFTSNGFIDLSFNTYGVVFDSFETGGNDGGYSIIVQPDGKIIVSGSSYIGTNPDNFALRRFNSDGSVDTSFGTNGTTITSFGGSYDLCYSSVLQDDGRIILGGYIINDSNYLRDLGLVRYTSDGNLDPSFGTNGISITNINGNPGDIGLSLALQKNNKILLAGYTTPLAGTDDFLVARFTNDAVTGIIDVTTKTKNYLVYPNPFNEVFSILNGISKSENIALEIYSIDGKFIKSISNYTTNGDDVITLGGLVKGVYFVKIISESAIKTVKILKK